MIEQMMMCTQYISNYHLCDFFIKIIDNEKIEESDKVDYNVYIIHIKRYTIRTCSELEK
jgi:hypothetical protein